MEWLINLLAILVCGWIIWDDFKNREIHLVALGILLGLLILFKLFVQSADWQELLLNGVSNLVILGFIFGITYLYLTKISKVINPWLSHLGVGDLLFFVSIVFLAQPIVFILIFISMTFFSLILGGILQISFKWNNIPYAGMSAIVLVFLLTLRTFNIPFENYIQSLIN